MRRIIAFSPFTKHSELGWAIAIDFELACDIGRQFGQDAVYYVVWNTLVVSHCDDRRKLDEIGGFSERLHLLENANPIPALRVPVGGDGLYKIHVIPFHIQPLSRNIKALSTPLLESVPYGI